MTTYTITRTHAATGEHEELMDITAESGAEARMWFASAIATMLADKIRRTDSKKSFFIVCSLCVC